MPNATEQAETSFEVGQTYTAHWPTDHTLRTLHTVVKRSPKFITIENSKGTQTRVGVHVTDGEEWALPFGRYSMAPTLRADRHA